MEKSFSESYKAAGVDITAGYKAVELMKSHIARTLTAGVCSDVGGFGGLFELDMTGIENPVLVAGTDGVECRRRLVPAIHNLVFIHHPYDRQWCIDFQRRSPVPFHYLKADREGSTFSVVPHYEMKAFMRACDPTIEGTRFIDPELLREKKRVRVRVFKPGPLFGLEGDFIRFGGRHYIAIRVSGSAALLKVSYTWCKEVSSN